MPRDPELAISGMKAIICGSLAARMGKQSIVLRLHGREHLCSSTPFDLKKGVEFACLAMENQCNGVLIRAMVSL